MHDFVRQIIALRKQFGDALAPGDYGSGAVVSWEDATAGTPANWNSRHLAVHYPKTANEPELEDLDQPRDRRARVQLERRPAAQFDDLSRHRDVSRDQPDRLRQRLRVHAGLRLPEPGGLQRQRLRD